MARLELAESAEAHLARIHEFLSAEDPGKASAALQLIFEALQLLERHPLIGRPAEDGLRELVISHGKTGYVALYAHEEVDDVVIVVALRHQREAGIHRQ